MFEVILFITTFCILQAFYERYQFLIGPKSSDLPGQIEEFLHGMGIGCEDIQIGKTKVYIKYGRKANHKPTFALLYPLE